MYNSQSTKNLGTRIRTQANFKDLEGKKISPSTVNLKYKTPSGEINSFTVVSDSNGVYGYELTLDISGKWYFRWECMGNYASSDEFEISVTDTKVK
jgi:hypothetical protein